MYDCQAKDDHGTWHMIHACTCEKHTHTNVDLSSFLCCVNTFNTVKANIPVIFGKTKIK